MNEYEIEDALRWFDPTDQPNLHRGAVELYQLKENVNAHSDGWPYWQKPKRASAKLQALITSGRELNRGNYGDLSDVGRTELARAFTPIKSFLTREKVDHKLIFGG
jgi:hypothetical protein